MASGREHPVPVQRVYGKWIWGLEIPWLPDLLAEGPEASLTGKPIIEAFGRQIAFIRALASTKHGEAFQLRFVGDVDPNGPVRCILLGRAPSQLLATDSASLVLGALPGEFPTRPITEADLDVQLDFIKDGGPSSTTFAEIRRRIEPVSITADGAAEDEIVLPWTWTPQSLLSSIELLRRQDGVCLLGVHLEARRPSHALRRWLSEQVYHLIGLLGDETNPLPLAAIGAYRMWQRDLPSECLHLRVFLAGSEPLLPGSAEQVGLDLSRSWEAMGGPGQFDASLRRGSFSIEVPESSDAQISATRLIEEVESSPVQELEGGLAELQTLFGAEEANTAFRLPITPKGGLEGLATARISSLAGGHESVDDASSGVAVGARPGGGGVRLTLRDFNQHLLVAGLPGFGKTTTLQGLLTKIVTADPDRQGVPFLVIDPAKYDYRHLVAELRRRGQPCLLFSPDHTTPAFNPLAPPNGVDVHRHAGRVLAAFDAALGFTPIWPAGFLLLGRALFEAFDQASATGAGWPTLSDLYRTIAILIRRAGYSESAESDLEASLLGRIEFLAAGATGSALLGDSQAIIDWDTIMSTPSVIELGAFAGVEERSLMFALLFAGLVSWREAQIVPDGSPTRAPRQRGLVHLTVLEEAHRVLSAREGSVGTETFVQAIAELRGAGEGFVVVEQAPSLLHRGVLKLTGSKIVHRIVDSEERTILGASMLLDARQQEELGRLATGFATVHTASASAAALVEIDRPETDTSNSLPEVSFSRTFAPPGTSGGLSLACLDCPDMCNGIFGRTLTPKLAEARDGQPPARLAVQWTIEALQAIEALPRGMSSATVAYCAAAHKLAETHVTSMAQLRDGLRTARVAHARIVEARDRTVASSRVQP